MYNKILSQLPADYYSKGVKTNVFQWIWHSWKWKSMKPFLKNVNGEVLDIGCADGTLTSKLADFLPKAKITGVDLYEKSIKYAQRDRSDINFIKADARKLPFTKNKFDVVVCVETLEHIPQNYKVVQEIYRCLKKDGIFLVVQDTDNFLFNLIWSVWTKWKGRVWDGAHVKCMNPKEIKDLLKKSRLKIIKSKYSHFGLEILIKAKKTAK